MSTAIQNLLSPVILFFLLGIGAGLLGSSLTIPRSLSKSVALYLMMAIGFRGGVELSHGGFDPSILGACLAAASLSAVMPVVSYVILRWTTGLDQTNAAAISAHYGSVSVVTFAAAIAVLNHRGEWFEPYIVALLAVMEAPAILTGLMLARRGARETESGGAAPCGLAHTVLHEVLLHGSIVLLLGSFAIGWIAGQPGYDELSPVFVAPFKGVLCVFLLDMGLLVAARLGDLQALRVRVAMFGVIMPLVGAAAGLGTSIVLGLSTGGATLMAVLGAGASYIVVPAVMRAALPTASPALALTLALGITFPFNLVVGIPLYHAAAHVLVPSDADSAAGLIDLPIPTWQH